MNTRDTKKEVYSLATWYRSNMQPSVASIEKICDGLGITLSQFFTEDEDPLEHSLSESQKKLFEDWAKLTVSQQKAIYGIIAEFQNLN